MSKLVTIFGGSGFAGRYIARRMAKEGWRVRVAVRRPNEAIFVRPYGAVGQVEPILANIRDDASVAAAIAGADAVVNCVGVLTERGKNSFEAVQTEGAARIARLAAEAGVCQLVHLSAIGADAESDSDYARSKAEGEAAVQTHFPGAVILRPSVIFGTEDEFFNRFAKMTKFGPVLPLVGGNSRFQPVYVDDVAKAAVAGVLGQAEAGVYELGGPDVETLHDLMVKMLGVIRRRRLIVNLPFWVGSVMAFGFGAVQALTVGLIHNGILTRDQLRQLRRDNVVSDGARGFADLGIDPTDMDAVLAEYLWVYRPGGQYSALQDSARNLRNT
ncbi:complex I NDUFA9 subunit family protein [Nioella sediminis]|jgi:NADH dehydrogenase|uniref:complex I NDUFA9 subunit family protein n=1 Tax=Nioella sediminis TaxID=1912092 RepID=UPI0008FCE8CF|nr:complex I NDUFA9 subunit family protein [Nioella sediminis]TBX28366.1 3-beta hydroxysteroid dehydrogenase [Roseovarius sp. JS7-11]